ncbi:MAG: amidohydrolase family protein, partial [Solobacterium sp.]|nr:amidohydrolase family protein [Solobacterium sp.]
MKKGYINCNIWQNPATAFATSDEYIIKVGTNQEIEELLCKEGAEIIDLKGMFVVPGFVDSHMHLAELGMYLSNVVLDDCRSNEEVVVKVKEKLATTKAGEWIIGRGYNEESFPDHQKPTRKMLDEISTEVPIALTRACGHVLSANTAALNAAGITEHTKVEGGNIDYENGFVEENALNNIHNAYPQPDVEKIKEYIHIGARYANQFGITTVGSDDFLAVAHDY